MSTILLRRRGLGKASCDAIVALSKQGIGVICNDVAIPPEVKTVIRWGCTSHVHGRVQINRADAIHLVNDKGAFRRILNINNLCPKTWFHLEEIVYPAIVRPARHAQGKDTHLCNTYRDLVVTTRACGPGFYASEYIEKVAEYRVFVVQGRVVVVANKIPADPKAIAWNVALGGKFENVKWGAWPLTACQAAVDAFRLSGLHFGGVDVIVDKGGKAYVLEINSAPSITSPYRQQCMAKAFDWMLTKGTDQLELGKQKDYRKFIHPAIQE